MTPLRLGYYLSLIITSRPDRSFWPVIGTWNKGEIDDQVAWMMIAGRA